MVQYLETPIIAAKRTPVPRYGIAADGYSLRSGAPSQYMVRLENNPRWYRVMVWQFSNAGTAFIRIKGIPYVLRNEAEIAILAEQSQYGNCPALVDMTDNEYCDDCQSFECECGHYADGSDIPHEGSQLENCDIVEDIDSHKMWLCKQRLPTHETKSRHTLLFVKLEYLEYYGDDIVKELGKYCVSIIAVNPSMAGKQGAMQACESIGMDYDEYCQLPIAIRAMTLAEYGTKATLWEQCGNSSDELLTKANTELSLVHMLGGFYLDKPQNALGSTGWDFMRGDILAGLKTCKTPESDIVRKMMGKQQ